MDLRHEGEILRRHAGRKIALHILRAEQLSQHVGAYLSMRGIIDSCRIARLVIQFGL